MLTINLLTNNPKQVTLWNQRIKLVPWYKRLLAMFRNIG